MIIFHLLIEKNATVTMCHSKTNNLKELNIIDNNTKIYGTHISHDGMGCHDEIEEIAVNSGYNIAYDGLEINI